MTVHKIAMLLAACLTLAVQSVQVRAQSTAFPGDFVEHNLQFFSPVDLDFESRPEGKKEGWFFQYDKLSWAMTGDRVAVGDPNVQVQSEIIITDELTSQFGFTSSTLTAADFQYPIINGLQDVAPTADFGWGERYEFGYSDGVNGWRFSILDGPEVNVSDTFGTGTQQGGFGSIHVNFATPPNFLVGFRDYGGGGAAVNGFVIPLPITNGPIGNGFLVVVGDGFIDDLDGDGVGGAAFILADIDGDGTIGPNEVIGVAVDGDDLHRFNVTFDSLTVRNTTETQGIELMGFHTLSNKHHQQKLSSNELQVGFGARFLRLRDEFSFNGTSPLLGTAGITTATENQLIGPQLQLKWTNQQGRWTWSFDGRCMLAYNVTDADQTGSYGLDALDATGLFVANPGLLPGGTNRLISGQPNTFSYGRRNNEFSPTIELRADLSYQITSSISARLGYTGIFVDNISLGLRPLRATRFLTWVFYQAASRIYSSMVPTLVSMSCTSRRPPASE